MRYIFCTCIFLFLAMFAQAQQTVTYISFFPPTNITHNEVTLKQNENSFPLSALTSGENTQDYHTHPGTLILGSANNANIDISSMTIKVKDKNVNAVPYAISNFIVDNIIRVNSKGSVSNIVIGDLTNPSNSCGYIFCHTVSISANSIQWPLKTSYPSSYTASLSSSGRTIIANLKYQTGNSTYEEFLPKTVPTNDNGSSNRELASTDKIEWRRLRINGTETCRMYLTLNPLSDPNTILLGGECQSPSSQCVPGHGGQCEQ